MTKPRLQRVNEREARRDIVSLVYAVLLPDNVVKIGHTTNLDDRLGTLAKTDGIKREDITVLAVLLGATHADEQAIHKRLVKYRVRGREYYGVTRKVWHAVNEMRATVGLKALPTKGPFTHCGTIGRGPYTYDT